MTEHEALRGGILGFGKDKRLVHNHRTKGGLCRRDRK